MNLKTPIAPTHEQHVTLQMSWDKISLVLQIYPYFYEDLVILPLFDIYSLDNISNNPKEIFQPIIYFENLSISTYMSSKNNS